MKISQGRWSGPTCARRAEEQRRNAGFGAPGRAATPIAALQVKSTNDWSRSPDLNWGPTDYESVALPTELLRLASEGNGSVERGETGVKRVRNEGSCAQRVEISTSISD